MRRAGPPACRKGGREWGRALPFQFGPRPAAGRHAYRVRPSKLPRPVRLPDAYRDKVRVIFDGIDTGTWRPSLDARRRIGPLGLRRKPISAAGPSRTTSGMLMRCSTFSMRFAKRLGDLHPDVQFIVAGQDRVCYGDDRSVTGGKSFKRVGLAHGGAVARDPSGPWMRRTPPSRPGPGCWTSRAAAALEKTGPAGGRSQSPSQLYVIAGIVAPCTCPACPECETMNGFAAPR